MFWAVLGPEGWEGGKKGVSEAVRGVDKGFLGKLTGPESWVGGSSPSGSEMLELCLGFLYRLQFI
jgi:hypothetical protein